MAAASATRLARSLRSTLEILRWKPMFSATVMWGYSA